MRRFSMIFLLSFLLTSCEFKCKVGETSEKNDADVKPLMVNGARVYNGIELTTEGVKLNRAYLVFKNSGDRVPQDNFVDFTEPVKIILLIDSGWVSKEGKCFLGAAETIITEKGKILLDEKDLFSSMPEGVTEEDAKTIALTAEVILPRDAPPTSFTIKFRVWDKIGNGVIEGSYSLYSK